MTRCVVALLTSVAQRVGFHVLETRSGSSQHGPSRLWWRGLYMEVVQTLSFMLTGIPRFEVQQKAKADAVHGARSFFLFFFLGGGRCAEESLLAMEVEDGAVNNGELLPMRNMLMISAL